MYVKNIKNRKKAQNMILAIDDVSLPFKKNTVLCISKPVVRSEPVLKPSPLGSGAPDDLAAHFYGTVLHDEGKFRMWYYAVHRGKNPDLPPYMMQQIVKSPAHLKGRERKNFQGPLCYAESDDGIVWKKPSLEQVLFKGSRANNALALPHTVVSGATVIKDMDEPDPARRYKMVYQFYPACCDPVIEEYGTVSTVALAVSPDGLKWNVIGIPFPNQFVEHASFIKHHDYYIIHHHNMEGLSGYSEGGSPSGRKGVARKTADFFHWPDLAAESFALVEPEDRSLRGINGLYDQVHLGVGAASFGNVCVGLYGLWHNGDFLNGFDQISGDLGLLVSNDGIHFREPVKGYRFITRENSPVTPAPGYNFNTILCQANGILNVGDETLIYHGRWRNTGHKREELQTKYYGEVALATIPRDRWGAMILNPDSKEGMVCSAPVELPPAGCELYLNADVVSGLTVKLLDKNFRSINGFSNGRVNSGDGLDCRVEWSGHELSELGGKTVRVQITLDRVNDTSPCLYAMYVI